MRRFIVLLMLLFTYIPAWSKPLPSPLPDTIYFSVDWCPRKEDLTGLSKHLRLTMNGCCIGEAAVSTRTKAHPEVLAPWEYRISVDGYPNARCDGIVSTDQDEELAKLAYENWKKEFVEKEKVEAPARLAAAASKVKSMSKEEFCVAYGKAVRGEEIDEEDSLQGAALTKLVKNEAGRRKLKFDDKLTSKAHIKLGISECQLYASWGMPEDQNRTVGSWGVHVQHVFGLGSYVYTENGRVSSWQN